MNVTETGIIASNEVLPKRMQHKRVHATTSRRTDSGRGGNGGVGNVVMKASRSEAAASVRCGNLGFAPL